MDTRPPDEHPSAVEINQQRINLMTRLSQSVVTMHHIDELFQWLAYAITQRFRVALLQFWTAQTAAPTGQLTVQLRTMVRLDASLPDQVVINDHITTAVVRMLSERSSHRPQPVENIFSSHQVNLLKRYGLNYCIVCFVSNDTLLPPRYNEIAGGGPPTLFSMVTLLFFRQFPHVSLTATINQILGQSIEMARNRGLLLPAPLSTRQSPDGPQSFTPAPLQQEVPGLLETLIPRRKQGADFLLSSNPFSSSKMIIRDKNAHRLYKVIDGRTNVASLCKITGMNIEEAHVALQVLLARQNVEVYEQNGRLVDPFHLADHH